MNRLVLLLGLIACDAGLPLPAPTTPPPAVAAPIVTDGDRSYAIVRVIGARPAPCMDNTYPPSNWTFSVEGTALTLHAGVPGVAIRGTTLPGWTEQFANDTRWSERYYVAEIALATHGQIAVPLTCNGPEGRYDGTVLAVAPARDLDDARAQLAAATEGGLRGAVRLTWLGR